MRRCHTRSHSELGSQALKRQWYFVLRHGRVGRCQAYPYEKNIIVVTGGAGFVGTNLISLLLKKNKKKIISLDNYSSGTKNNHLINSRVKYIHGDTIEIQKKLTKYKKKK